MPHATTLSANYVFSAPSHISCWCAPTAIYPFSPKRRPSTEANRANLYPKSMSISSAFWIPPHACCTRTPTRRIVPGTSVPVRLQDCSPRSMPQWLRQLCPKARKSSYAPARRTTPTPTATAGMRPCRRARSANVLSKATRRWTLASYGNRLPTGRKAS